jgi:hypothetical protein
MVLSVSGRPLGHSWEREGVSSAEPVTYRPCSRSDQLSPGPLSSGKPFRGATQLVVAGVNP